MRPGLCILIVATCTVCHGLNLFNYGNWCGKTRTGIFPWVKPGHCNCSTSVQTCRKNKPPTDQLDEACLQHDYCTQCDNTNMTFRWCHCERHLVEKASRSTCATPACTGFRDRVTALFSLMPCYCKSDGMSCKEWLIFGKKEYCLKKNYDYCKD